VERLDVAPVRTFLNLGADIETLIADGFSALELAKLNFKIGQEGRLRNGWTKKGLDEKVFLLLIKALRARGLHSNADQALSEVREFSSKLYESGDSADSEKFEDSEEFEDSEDAEELEQPGQPDEPGGPEEREEREEPGEPQKHEKGENHEGREELGEPEVTVSKGVSPNSLQMTLNYLMGREASLF
jgi:hypothetical protein